MKKAQASLGILLFCLSGFFNMAYAGLPVEECDDLSDFDCFFESVRHEPFCDSITPNLSTGGYTITTPFGISEEISTDNDLISYIESNCDFGPKCPDGALGAPGGCYILVDSAPGSCPAGSVEDGVGQCRKPVADVGGGAKCPDGAFGVIGGCYTLVEKTPQCPLGSVEDGVGQCRKPVADAPGGTDCPVGASGVPGGCYILVEKTPQCPLASIEVAGQCRKPVADEPIPVSCPEDALGSPGACYIIVEKTLECPLGSVEVDGQCRKPVADE